LLLDNPEGLADLCDAWARGIAPRRPLSVPDWADRHRILSGKSASEPGPWRTSRIPYLRAIMAALDERDPAPLVVFVASAQVGKSEVALNWFGRTAHQAPASFLALFPSEKVARKWVRTRLEPMIASTPELRALMPLGRRSNSQNTLQEKHFGAGVLFTGSANIPDDVAGVSVPNVILDEVDRMPAVLEDEGDPIELALRRSAAFPRSKALLTSTPTVEERSRIWPYWLASTRGRYYVPCTHCGHLQALEWGSLKWIEGRPASAVYICEECAAAIEERNKPEMLAGGEWRMANPERAAEAKGFHVNGLYTPIGLGDSWARHAAAWEAARGKPARMQVFVNTRLGEIVKSEREKVEWEDLKARREPYRLRTIPRGILVLSSGTDVQGDRLETQVLGHGRDERIAVIDYIVHYGDPTRPEVWAELDEYLERQIVNEFGRPMRIGCSLIDAGYLQHEVANFTRTRRGRRIFAAKGSTNPTKQPIGRPTMIDVSHRGQVQKRGAEMYMIGVAQLKTLIYRRLRADAGTHDAPVLPVDRHIRFSDELPDEYFRQLSAEAYDPKEGWHKVYDRNEALDSFVLALAAAMHHSLAVHRYREEEWRRCEEQLERPVEERKDGDAAPEAPVLGAAPVPMSADRFFPTAARVHHWKP
jgi:phage terminase large subunit GpA-like protein